MHLKEEVPTRQQISHLLLRNLILLIKKTNQVTLPEGHDEAILMIITLPENTNEDTDQNAAVSKETKIAETESEKKI